MAQSQIPSENELEEAIRDSTDFAYEAMHDARDTIRAIDFKANALLVILAIAGTNVDKIAGAESVLLTHTRSHAHSVWLVIGIVAGILWLLSFGAACLILAGRYNPAKLVSHQGGATGILFSPTAFQMPTWSALWPQTDPASLARHSEMMTLTPEEVNREICFEHLKLVYIRNAKALRFRMAIALAFASFLLFCIVWASSALLYPPVAGG